SVSWLYYSDRLVEFPLGVFGVALGTVILPSLSQRHAESDPEAFGHTLDWALRWMVLIGLPSTLGLMLLAGPILATLFQHGAFEAADVRMARLSLMAYSVGLLGFIGVKVLAPGFYARQDTRTPVRIAVTAMVTNMVLNIAFVVPWAMSGTAGPHAGLALATALGAFTNSGLLFRRLRKDGVLRPGPGWSGFAGRVLAANVAMAVFLFGLAGPLADWLGWGTLERAGRLALLIAGAGAVYFGALRLVGIRLEQWVRLPRAGRT
ncbi:MAG TPA: lipid II flippase MurJ, partial [Gammaproteobacteria bacterium]|nr:lipid II flippase MurJ [Gammaproteobacteria bacterium]